MEVFYTTLLALGAFWLGACPFSVWIGRWLLGKNIRDYGDGNPGSTNVFRAGGRRVGSLALIVDIAKGVPFVVLAHLLFGLPEGAVMVVALSPILGHAFSPILRFRGGKSVAVTFGVLLALPQHEMLIIFSVLTILGFLLIEIGAWTVMFATAGSLVYLAATGGSRWELVFMLCLFVIFVIKHFRELQTIPRPKGKLIHWFQSRKTGT